VMSISARASSTGTLPIILQRYLISDTCAHLPRRTEALSGNQAHLSGAPAVTTRASSATMENATEVSACVQR
jgi:hypothetical protein